MIDVQPVLTSDFELATEFLSVGRIRWCLLLLRVNVFGSGDQSQLSGQLLKIRVTDSISVAASKEFERQSVAKTVTSRCTPRKLFDLKSLDLEAVNNPRHLQSRAVSAYSIRFPFRPRIASYTSSRRYLYQGPSSSSSERGKLQSSPYFSFK
jgi:hypothetical protein